MAEILKVVFDEIPKTCGNCPLMFYLHDTTPVCTAVPQEVFEIEGNPYAMKYRRSDCPAVGGDGDG